MAMSLPPVGSSRPPPDSLEKLDLTRIKTTQNALGRGKFGSVYNYGSFAIKIANDDEKSRKMLEKEYNMYELLEDTESFPKIKSHGEGYLIMEKLEKTLFDLLQQRYGYGHDKKVYFKQMVDAVKKCHDKKICHHDIKNDNFMIANYQIKLLDFGLSHKFEEQFEKTPIDAVSSLNKPPEILIDFQCSGHHDIFMLGLCLFELESGKTPFENTHNCRFWKEFIKENKQQFWNMHKKFAFDPSQDFKILFEGMMNPNPEERFNIDQVKTSDYYKSCAGVFDKFIDDRKAYRVVGVAVGASAASPFKKHKKRKSNKRVRGQRTSRRKASVSRKSKRGSARARRIKTALNGPLKKGRTPKARFHRGVPPPHGGI